MFYTAGSYVAGAAEETTLEQAQAQMEAYFFGALRLARAALPVLRRQKSGRLIFMSSGAGMVPLPFHSVHSASKAALEAWCDALRYEVHSFGVSVSYVQAGGVRTRAADTMQIASRLESPYEPERGLAIEAFKRAQREGPPPEAIARTIAAIVDARRPRLCYRVGLFTRFTPLLKALLPSFVFRAQVRKMFDI